MDRTIEHLRNNETGELFTANHFFDSHDETGVFALRQQIERDHQDGKANVVCEVCNHAVQLVGTVKQQTYFRHYADTDECPIKTAGKYSQEDILRMKFNGQQESDVHKFLKHKIYEILCTDSRCSNVLEDTIRRSIVEEGRWRKPDVGCDFGGKRIVFEIQLSTTFLSVMIAREKFYRENKTSIIWVFREFNELKRFVEKDAYYLHRGCIFVLDAEAIERSTQEKRLFLHCFTKLDCRGVTTWNSCFVELSQLIYDAVNFEAYFMDMALEQLRYDFETTWLNRPADFNWTHYEGIERQYKARFENLGLQLKLFDDQVRILNALYSLKHRKIVGFRYSSFEVGLMQIVHVIIESSEEFLYFFLWALIAFNLKDAVEAADKKTVKSQHPDVKGKFATKIGIYKKNRHLDARYNRNLEGEKLLSFLFPDVKLS